ncbi:hypothetical protein GCM10027018_04320 [Paenibacillus thermoaerophilus]
MHRWMQVLRTKRGLIAAWTAFVAAVVFAAGQYAAKEKYEAYVSYRLDEDMRRFVEWLETSDRIYADILEKGTIRSRQRHLLMSLHEDMAGILRAYRELAVRLGLRDDSFHYTQSTVNAMKIVRYFYDGEVEGPIQLDQSRRDHITAFREFDATWLAAVDRSTASYRVHDASWHRLLDAIETSTTAFLAERQLKTLDDLWLDRTEIR